MANDTPMMRQYGRIKAKHHGAVLLFRMGDFYEMFHEDAEVCARVLGLTLTSRSKGEKAILTRREVVRFLQDNVVAIHDHAWGDGELFAKYSCQPGVPVDFYEDGSKHNILISLRETKNRGDVVEFWIERVIKGGLLKQHEWFETEVDHWMRKLKLSIVFPEGSHCRRATLSRRSTGKTTLLRQEHFALLPDGRQRLAWETGHPNLHDRYSIKWVW